MAEFDIYIKSFDPAHPEAPVDGLCRVFGFDRARARAFVGALPRMVKRGVPEAHLPRYEKALAGVGAIFEMRPAAIRPQQIIAVESTGDSPNGGDTLTLPPPNERPAPMPVLGVQGTVVGRAAAASSAQPVTPTRTLMEEQPAGALAGAAERTAVDLQPPAWLRDDADPGRTLLDSNAPPPLAAPRAASDPGRTLLDSSAPPPLAAPRAASDPGRTLSDSSAPPPLAAPGGVSDPGRTALDSVPPAPPVPTFSAEARTSLDDAPAGPGAPPQAHPSPSRTAPANGPAAGREGQAQPRAAAASATDGTVREGGAYAGYLADPSAVPSATLPLGTHSGLASHPPPAGVAEAPDGFLEPERPPVDAGASEATLQRASSRAAVPASVDAGVAAVAGAMGDPAAGAPTSRSVDTAVGLEVGDADAQRTPRGDLSAHGKLAAVNLDGSPGWLIGDDIFRAGVYDGASDLAPRAPDPERAEQTVNTPQAALEVDDVPRGKKPRRIPSDGRALALVGAAERAADRGHSERPRAIGMREPGRPQSRPPKSRPPPQGLPRSRPQAPAGAAAWGAAQSDDESLPLVARLLLRGLLAVVLFGATVALRQLGQSDVDARLASWSGAGESDASALSADGTRDEEGTEAERAAADERDEQDDTRPRPRARKIEPGPVALTWLESELHQVSIGDKDRVRGLVHMLKVAGAPEVYMGHIVRNGPMHLCGELVAELPDDARRRADILSAYERYTASNGLPRSVPDPGGRYLQVLP